MADMPLDPSIIDRYDRAYSLVKFTPTEPMPLVDALETLDEPFRTIVELHLMGGKSLRAIALHLRMSPSAVHAKYRKALEMIRDQVFSQN